MFWGLGSVGSTAVQDVRIQELLSLIPSRLGRESKEFHSTPRIDASVCMAGFNKPIRSSNPQKRLLHIQIPRPEYVRSVGSKPSRSRHLRVRAILIRSHQLVLDVDDIVVSLHLDHSVHLCTCAHQFYRVGVGHSLHGVAVLGKPVKENVGD